MTRTTLHCATITLSLFLASACGSDQTIRAGSAEQAEASEANALSLALIGEQVPDFTLTTTKGTRVRLSDYRGKIVVLEWINPRCPFTRHAHTLGLLRDYPNELRAEGGIWLGINSGSDQKLGGSQEETAEAIEEWGIEFPILEDHDGAVGRRFDATMTPEVFLIDTTGVLRYVGALDNMPFGKVRGGGEGQNYLARAIAQLRAGEMIRPESQQAYGCRVKYAQPNRQD